MQFSSSQGRYKGKYLEVFQTDFSPSAVYFTTASYRFFLGTVNTLQRSGNFLERLKASLATVLNSDLRLIGRFCSTQITYISSDVLLTVNPLGMIQYD